MVHLEYFEMDRDSSPIISSMVELCEMGSLDENCISNLKSGAEFV